MAGRFSAACFKTHRIGIFAAKSSFNYSYNSKNQLIRLQITSTALGPVVKDISYSYDVLGRRMEKKIINLIETSRSYSRRFVYDGDNLIGEYNQSSELLASYIHSPLQADDVLEVTYTQAAVAAGMTETYGDFYFLKDHLGSVTEIADSGGHIVQRYNYSAFGKIMDIKDAEGTDITAAPKIRNPFTFTGREWDEESGLYYYRARMYDAGIGRFLQVDPDPGKIDAPLSLNNKYAYAANNPTMIVDPSGRASILGWIAAAIDPIFALALMNTTDVFQSAFGFSSGDIRSVNAVALTTLIVVASIYTGGLAGGASGTFGGALLGGLAGAVTGATIGAIGAPALGLGTSEQGALFGGLLGAAAGAAAGYGFGHIANYGAKQLDLATNDTFHYFTDLTYEKSPLLSVPLGGGFAGPSLGGSAILAGLTYLLGEPKKSQ